MSPIAKAPRCILGASLLECWCALRLPAPLPFGGLVAEPDILAPAVPLERRVVLLAVVFRWRLGLSVNHRYELSKCWMNLQATSGEG